MIIQNYPLPPTQRHSFFRNYPLHSFPYRDSRGVTHLWRPFSQLRSQGAFLLKIGRKEKRPGDQIEIFAGTRLGQEIVKFKIPWIGHVENQNDISQVMFLTWKRFSFIAWNKLWNERVHVSFLNFILKGILPMTLDSEIIEHRHRSIDYGQPTVNGGLVQPLHRRDSISASCRLQSRTCMASAQCGGRGNPS